MEVVLKNAYHFSKKNIVLCISLILAIVSSVLVHPDAKYFSYIDFRTICILLSLMLIMAGLKELGVFSIVGEWMLNKARNMRILSMTLMLLCFVFSMFITNDVALITFVPFTIQVLLMADRKEYLIMVLVLETIGANLGSMMTPIGNPQNLYLFGLSGMTGGEFLLLMLPYTLISLLLLMAATFIFVHNEPVTVCIYQEKKIDTNGKRRLIMYGILFLLALCSVVRIIPFYIVMGVVAFCIMIWDRDIISKADYSLIFTFIFLFIFIGNMKRIPIVSTWLSSIVTGRETITAVLASQVISNVPAAILLPGFTKMIPSLIIGTNLGGLGTLIASMASLISFKLYDRVENCNKKKYLLVFTILNLAFLAVLFGFYLFNKSLRFH